MRPDSVRWIVPIGVLSVCAAVLAVPASAEDEHAPCTKAECATTQHDGSRNEPDGGNAFKPGRDPLGDRCGALRSATTFGDAADQVGLGVASDRRGNVVFGGAFQSTIDFDGCPLTSDGQDDAFLVKFDAFGRPLGSKRRTMRA